MVREHPKTMLYVLDGLLWHISLLQSTLADFLLMICAMGLSVYVEFLFTYLNSSLSLILHLLLIRCHFVPFFLLTHL